MRVAELSPALLSGLALLTLVAFVLRLSSNQIALTVARARGDQMNTVKAYVRRWWQSLRTVIAGSSESIIGSIIFAILTGAVVAG
ncbi:hypothetical protein VR45_05545 [Streptomyces sp. NRRL S-495]|nr:hypothetical protein VR45_05545 [Streptomyces sp. NRRL S-495]